MSDAERLKAYGSIYTLSMTTTDDTDLQVRSIYDMINEAARQENLNEEVASRMTLIRYFYNYDLNDSLYAHAHEQMSFMRGHKLWDSYYELWSILANGYAYNGMNNTALQEAQGMFQDAMTHNNNLGLGLAYYVMGNVYNNMNNTDEAINAYKESIRFTEKLDTLPLSAPDVYSYLGDVYAAQKKFSELRDLLVPWKKLLDTFEKEGKGRPENWAYYNLARVQADLGLNNLDDAEQLLENVLDSLPEGADFLHQSVLYYKAQLRLQQQRYLEALFLNTQRMQFMMDSDDKSVLIDVRRQRAEIMKHLGRFEEAAELYRQMYVINDSINTHDTKHQLAEMNAQFRVGQIEKEQAEAKMRNLIIIATIIVLSLVIFIYFRVRSARRLSKTHKELERTHSELEVAYDQLEKATEEREKLAAIEKDLQTARNIQMSMVPATFPDRKDLDLYAAMTPAKEVGGDLYGYLLLTDKLYFALGDVSGKGVPASLFMAQATRLFRTLASQNMMPAEIAMHINDALSGEDNENGMFVTMFIGLLDLNTGHLDFCNAGHNPPVLISDGKAEFIEMQPNAPIGLWQGMEYEGEELENITNKPLFVYSDGLNEAENRQQEQFSDERLLELLSTRPFESSKATIEMLRAEVEKHRDGAEPNDDLTMLCVKLTK